MRKIYLIFGMCGESFSITYTADIPEDVDRGLFMTFVTLLNQFYRFFESAPGGILGSLISFNTEEPDFVMTAMFVVIFPEQWLKDKNRLPAVLGIGLSLICLVAFGADYFMLPSAVFGLLVVYCLKTSVCCRKVTGCPSLSQLRRWSFFICGDGRCCFR